MSCDVGKATEGLELCSFSNLSVTSPTSQLILQPFRRFPTSQLILQPFCCFTYVTAHSPTLLSLLLRHRLFTYVTWTRYIHKTFLTRGKGSLLYLRYYHPRTLHPPSRSSSSMEFKYRYAAKEFTIPSPGVFHSQDSFPLTSKRNTVYISIRKMRPYGHNSASLNIIIIIIIIIIINVITVVRRCGLGVTSLLFKQWTLV